MDKEIKLNWGIPISWLDVKLDDIAIIIQGQSPPSSTYNDEQIGLPFFQGKAEFTDLHPVVKVWCKAPTKIAEPNDILLSVRAPVGSTNLANVKCGIGRGLSAIRYQYAHKFVFYYLRLIERELDKRGTGTTFKAISGDVVRNTHIPLPPLNEQNRIVDKLDELLSELEKGKEQLQTSLEQLKVYRQSILKHAFEGKLSEEWRRKQKKQKTPDELVAEIKAYRKQQYENQLKEYKAGKIKVKPKEPKEIIPVTASEIKALPELPNGWTYVKVSSLGDIETGTTPSKAKPEYYGDKYPFYKPTELDAGFNVRKAKEYLSESGIKQARFLPVNSILVTSIGATIGKTGIIRVAGASNQQINAIVPHEIFNPNFLYFQAVGQHFQDQIQSNAVATTLPILNKSKFEKLVFAICSQEEQNFITDDIESKFSNIEKMEETIIQNLKVSDTLKQSLLQKAFEGKLVEQDPTDEPASVLLERIKKEREEYLKAEKEKKKIQKEPMKKKSAAKDFEFPLIDTIKDKFGRKSFTFDQLKSEVGINYDDLREELFSLLDNEKVLAMEFDQKKESMNFKYVGK